MTWRVAVDVGGTFTDLVIVTPDGSSRSFKVLSTPPDFDVAVCEGIDEALRRFALDPSGARQVVHGTTAGTNAVLERTGPPTGLLTTEGFRDVLEIGRLRTPAIYDLRWEKPRALARRRHRVGVSERIDAHGAVLAPLDTQDLSDEVDRLVSEGVRTLAISLLNSYVNPSHERALGAWVDEHYPQLSVSIGSEIVREVGEYERASTAVLNAYLVPVLARYLGRLTDGLQGIGVRAPLFIMQSSGGMMPLQEAMERPVQLLESGPAAGVLAAAGVAGQTGLRQAISFDMGGTTAKASLIEDHAVAYANEFSIGGEVSSASRLLRGGGYAVRLPTIDLAEVGAGGGSIAEVDSAGGLSVGPASAGAVPGPACYGRGGDRPTVTDANVVLGYLSVRSLRQAGVPADADLAEQAVKAHVAGPLEMSVHEAAHAIHTVANRRMARVLRAVTTERGRSLSEHALIVFGGSGPIHGAELAASVHVRKVVVPPLAGVLSAVGLLWAPIALAATQTVELPLTAAYAEELEGRLVELARRPRQRLLENGFADADIIERREVDCCYPGQATELTLTADGTLDRAEAARLVAAFHAEHLDTYAHGGSGEVVAVRLRLTLSVEQPPFGRGEPDYVGSTGGGREVWFRSGQSMVPVVHRGDIEGPTAGPLLIDEADTTVVVPPGWTASCDGFGNLHLETGR